MKIVVAGNYGACNLGDELILEGMIKTLRQIEPQSDLTILSANPRATKEKFEARSLYKFPAGFRSFIASLFNKNLKNTYRAVKECDVFILGGGGLFDPTSKRGVLIWAIQTIPAILNKKKVIMYGQNLPKIEKGIINKIVQYLFKKAVFVALRDNESMENINAFKMPDLIFKSHLSHSEPKENKIILALRKAPIVTDEHLHQIAKFINFIQDEQKDLTVELIPFEKNTDERLIESILDLLAEKDRINVHAYTEDRTKIEKIFTSAKVVIGMRLHSILMAINTGTPFIALGYNEKIKNILSSLKLEEYLIEMNELNLEKMKELFEKIISNSEEAKVKILNSRDKEIAKFEHVEKELLKAFHS